jgi:sterol desaturase/sphingolipid hydroxylase (fatty acid hydroxylase superfamily)
VRERHQDHAWRAHRTIPTSSCAHDGTVVSSDHQGSEYRRRVVLAAKVESTVAGQPAKVQRTCSTAAPPVIIASPDASTHAAARHVWSLIYFPAFLVPAFAALLVGIGWSTRWGGADFAGSLTDLRVAVIGPLAFAMIAVFLIVERLRPAQRRPLVARGHRHDVLFAVFNAIVVLPLVTALTLSFAEVVRNVVPWVVLPRFGLVPRWGAITLILIAMDGCNWSVHLANHRVRMLWRFHELHHSQEDMNVLTVFRTHPLIHVSYLVALVPGVVLLANGELPTMLLVVYGAVVAFAHSNTNLSFGLLGRVFVSPNYHRIHHRLHGPQDVNLGFTLTIWDQFFHRAVFPTPETIRADTGLPQRPLRIEQEGSQSHHLRVFAAQLVGPFRPMNEPSELPSIREPIRPLQLDENGPTPGRHPESTSPTRTVPASSWC